LVKKEQNGRVATVFMWIVFVLSIGSLLLGYSDAWWGGNAMPWVFTSLMLMVYAIFFAIVRLK